MDNNQSEYLKQLGDNIRRIRKEKGITQEHVSMDSDVPISQLSAIENGKMNTTVSTLKRIATILEVPVKDFFTFE